MVIMYIGYFWIFSTDMDAESLLEILNDWNFWQKTPFSGIPREKYLEKMRNFSDTGQVVVLSGVRRSGKSTLMLQYIASLIRQGLDPSNTLYVNLEDPRFHNERAPDVLRKIYEVFLENLTPRKPHIFLDEVQNVSGWEKFVRSLHERKEAVIFVSGSSSRLLSAEFGSALTGRHLMIEVFPLDFREFLRFSGLEVDTKLSLLHNRLKIRRLLRDYLDSGGFPQVALSGEKKELLVRYFEDVLTKDVSQRYRIRKPEKLRALALFYLANVSSLISFNRAAKFLSLTLDTVERFSHFLATSYLLLFSKKFSYSLKEQEVNPRKVYAVDVGLRNAVVFKTGDDLGRRSENAVFLHLRQTCKEVYYWKDGRECDFMLRDGGRLRAVQVTNNFENPIVRDRELKGLLAAAKKFNLKSGLVIDNELEGEERVKGTKIEIVPLWKWLLGHC